jgi:hypothetical protein
MSNKVLMMKVTKTSFKRAIREKCMDCCAGNDAEVRKCELLKCPLFPYRFGCSPASAIRRYGDKVKIVSIP